MICFRATAAWPRHCQARYVTTDIGRQQPWANQFPQSIVDQQIADIGWDTFERLHHYCAGIIWLNRSRMERDLAAKRFDLRTAMAEVRFTYDRLDKQHPIATSVMIALAQVCQATDDNACAQDTLEQAINRAGVKAGNKGFEAAMSAVELVNLYKEMDGGEGTSEAKKKAFPHVV